MVQTVSEGARNDTSTCEPDKVHQRRSTHPRNGPTPRVSARRDVCRRSSVVVVAARAPIRVTTTRALHRPRYAAALRGRRATTAPATLRWRRAISTAMPSTRRWRRAIAPVPTARRWIRPPRPMIVTARSPAARRRRTPVPVAIATARRRPVVPASRRRPAMTVTIAVITAPVAIAVDHRGAAVTAARPVAVITVTGGIDITDPTRNHRGGRFRPVIRIATRCIAHVPVIRIVVTAGERKTGR